jgi:hypothetical protein
MDLQEFHWPTKRLYNFGTGMTFVCEFSSKVRFPVIFVATDAVGDSTFITRAVPPIFSVCEILAIDIHNRSISAIPCQENAAEECHCLKDLLMIRIGERSFFDGQSLEEGVRDHTGKLPREDSGRRKRRSRRLS